MVCRYRGSPQPRAPRPDLILPRLGPERLRAGSRLQTVLCDRLGLEVTVHYPTGCSNWNPVEHRLFSFISWNCVGTPLRIWELFLAAIRGTTTKAGLTVQAVLHSDTYQSLAAFSARSWYSPAIAGSFSEPSISGIRSCRSARRMRHAPLSDRVHDHRYTGPATGALNSGTRCADDLRTRSRTAAKVGVMPGSSSRQQRSYRLRWR